MSATTIMDEAIPNSAGDSEPQPAQVESAECGCCGLTEECTINYIARVRERYSGWWVCGLCAEVVNDEILRSDFRITTEEALDRHMNFCNRFRSSTPPSNPTEDLISAVRHILRRSLDSPRAHRSSPNTPRRAADNDSVVRPSSLPRSDSCFPALAS